MKKMFKTLIYIGAFLCACPALAKKEAPQLTKHQLQQTIKKLDLEIPIRVLLEEKNSLADVHWKCGSQSGFLVYIPETKQKTVFQALSIDITCKDKQLCIGGTRLYADHIFIIPFTGPFVFQKNVYDGVIAVTIKDKSAYFVNHVDLEDYILSVLPYESCPGWPDEVHKACCIVFRSYGIAKVLEARAQHERNKCPAPYDIQNTNKHQIYKGRSFSGLFKKVVEETRGVVLAHDNKPILAMFDICCGGIIPARKKGIHFAKAPYLARTYPCNFCKPYKYCTWSHDLTFDELQQGIKKEIPGIGTIKDIKIASIDDATVVQEIKIRGTHKWHTLPASKFKSLFKETKSLCFTFEKNGRNIKVSGKGHGHHMGLCQRGAYYMVLKGWKHRNILKFFYPDVMFMKLKKK